MGSRGHLRYFGVVLCFLLFCFAVGTKAALYSPDQAQVKGFTATKVWQNKSVPSTSEFPVAAAFPVLLAMMILSPWMSYRVVEFVRPEPTSIRDSAWFSPYLSVRPPPAI